MPTSPDTLDLLIRWQTQHHERDRLRLLRLFEPLAFKVATARCRQHRGAEVEDAVQAANIGLLRAINTFDSASETSLKAYIKRAMLTEINRTVVATSRAVVLPSYASAAFAAIGRAQKALLAEGVTDPTSEQLAARIDGFSAERVERLLASSTVSLDIPVHDDPDGVTSRDVVPDDPEHRPDIAFEAADSARGIRAAVDRALCVLGPRSQQILRMHLLDGVEAATVAQRLGVSRQAVGLCLKKALPRLQASLRAEPHVAEALV
jgi:RNA polymerase sigma factor (sigma-70 family)